MFSVKKNWQLQLQVNNICHINNMFRTRSLSLMYCVNLAELTHISLLLMRVLTRCTRGDARSFFLYSQNVVVCTKRNFL